MKDQIKFQFEIYKIIREAKKDLKSKSRKNKDTDIPFC